MTNHTVSTKKTYLYNNIEVKLTGRFTRKIKTRGVAQVDILLYEVQPADSFNGEWKKWAAANELLEIYDMEKKNDSQA